MAKVDVAALAAEYLAEAETLKQRYETLAARVGGYRGDEAMVARRKMNVFYAMYLECRSTGRYLYRCAQEAAECVH